jgi:hypothetical protein
MLISLGPDCFTTQNYRTFPGLAKDLHGYLPGHSCNMAVNKNHLTKAAVHNKMQKNKINANDNTTPVL